MDLLILNSNLESTSVLDTFESLIWTDRYFKYGDFEIYTPVTSDILTILKEDYYLWSNSSDHVMIIEDIEIDTDVENGNHLKVTGRSLESILDRRIIWGQTILNGNFQNGILKLLNENVISPTDTSRQIPNFIFEASTDTAITSLTIDTQFTGDNLYKAIQSLCETERIGFSITLTDTNQFKFKLYSGKDRSYDQITNPYVVFSPNFENILNSNYVKSKKTLKTVTLVAGEGEGFDRRTTTVAVTAGSGSGLSRRELFTDAREVSSTIDGGTLTDSEYLAQLAQKGSADLAENTVVTSFEGEVETSHLYEYGEDFFMGDILQIANEYGIESKVRVVEVIRSQSLSSTNIHPTFTTV